MTVPSTCDNLSKAEFEEMWELQIWDWQHSATSINSILIEKSHQGSGIYFCFLGNNRLLQAVDFKLNISIEEKFQTPSMLFVTRLIPGETVPPSDDDIEHSSRPQMQEAQHMMYASDPKHRIFCLITNSHHFHKGFLRC